MKSRCRGGRVRFRSSRSDSDALAENAKQPKVKKLAERLITAHSATVDWITTVLAEEALGGPTALRATAFQRVAGGASRL